jgi:hypothetical protein
MLNKMFVPKERYKIDGKLQKMGKEKIIIYKTIILPVVLYGCETWSLTLREVHRLRVLENRVLMRILGPRRDDVTADWRKLHNEELHNCTPRQT